MTAHTPTRNATVRDTLVDDVVRQWFVSPPLDLPAIPEPNRTEYVIQPGTTVVQHATSMLGHRAAHLLGLCACPWWHARDPETGRWFVERVCGRDRVQTSQRPTHGQCRTRGYAEQHACDVAERLNGIYQIGGGP